MLWFKHDSNASMDAKLQEIVLDYGLEGYGLYWYCIELITQKVRPDNITFELEHDARVIARNMGSTPQKITEMMTRMVDLGLFGITPENRIQCKAIAKRLDQSMTNSPVLRAAIKNMREGRVTALPRHDETEGNTDTVKTRHDNVMTSSGDVMKERKKERKESRGRFTPPTLSEVAEHIQAKGYSVHPETFWHFYEAKGWMVGKNKMKSWHSAVAQWASREQTGKSSEANPFAGAV